MSYNAGGFGICFDIDGVLRRGQNILPPTKPALDLITDKHGDFTVPVIFVTNSVSRDEDKAQGLCDSLGVNVSPDQIVQAHSPLNLITEYHKKKCLVLGQGTSADLAKEIGFTDVITIDEIKESMPNLDVMDHKVKFSAAETTTTKVPQIDAILCMKEPLAWESTLQIATDVLLTGGQLDQPAQLDLQLPVIACNVDLQYMDKAHLPRYGNGSFLVCLESLYKRLTGEELVYSVLSGKPSELTFQYAESKLQRQAQRLGVPSPIERMYMIGDNAMVDIVGANLYRNFIKNKKISSTPYFRKLPSYANIPRSTVKDVFGLLVRTGVTANQKSPNVLSTCQKDFRDIKLTDLEPAAEFDDVLGSVQYILKKENHV